MPLLDRIRNAWGALTKAAPYMAGYGYQYGYGPTWSDQFRFRRAPTPQDLVENYKALIYVCANINANACSRSLPSLYVLTRRGDRAPKCATRRLNRFEKEHLKSYWKRGATDSRAVNKAFAHADNVEEVTEHPLLESMLHCNPHKNLAQATHETVLYLDTLGYAFWVPDEFALGIPREFWPIMSQWVYPIFTGQSMVPDGYQFGPNRYPADDMLRFAFPSIKNPYGMGYGPAQAAIEYARLEGTYVNIQEEMLANGPRPDMIISLKDDKASFGLAERDRLEARLNQRARGGRAGSAVAVDAPVSITPMSYSPTDLAGLELSKYDMERIANCFGVPISFLTDEDSNKANSLTGMEKHARNAVEPRHKLIAAELTRYTHSLDPDDKKGMRRLFWEFPPQVQEDKQAQAELHKKYVDMGVVSRNEVRIEIGYDAVPDGDTILVANNLMPLSDAATSTLGADGTQDTDAATEDLPMDGAELEEIDDDAEQTHADEAEAEADDEEKALRERLVKTLDAIEGAIGRETA